MTETASVEISADVNSAYGTISDHAVLGGITPHIKSVRVKSRRPERYLAEEVLVLGGREYLCMIRHYCRPPHTHEYTVVGGDAKGSRITEKFESTAGGTRITASIDWKTGFWGMLGHGSVRDDYAEMLCAAAPR